MSKVRLDNVRLKGVASAVPAQVRTLEDDKKIFDEAEVNKISASTGVTRRHIVSPGVCTSDLCLAAAEHLLAGSGWGNGSIDVLVFVSQTPDYVLPATSCSLHSRLKLSKNCAAFDVNLGCSGYIYGLWLASSLLASGGGKRALVLVGDTSSRLASSADRSVALLFGDAGTATILELDTAAPPLHFVLGTDGTGQDNLIVPAGAFRNQHSEVTSIRRERENGNFRSDEELHMNGAEIFAFTLNEVPGMINSVLEEAGWDKTEVDAFVMHQANKFMLEHLAKRMKLPAEKVILTMGEYGNTSSASIPLSMTHALSGRLAQGEMRLVLAGFGVGYSWGALAVTAANLVMPDLVIVP